MGVLSNVRDLVGVCKTVETPEFVGFIYVDIWKDIVPDVPSTNKFSPFHVGSQISVSFNLLRIYVFTDKDTLLFYFQRLLDS